jgi:hypothetical protein
VPAIVVEFRLTEADSLYRLNLYPFDERFDFALIRAHAVRGNCAWLAAPPQAAPAFTPTTELLYSVTWPAP